MNRTSGSASRPAPGRCGRARGRLQVQASSVAVWIEFWSRDRLNALEESLPLRDGKSAYEPSECREKSILIAGL